MSDKTLQTLLAERVTAYAQSDRPRELIDAGIDKMFKDVVDDAFRSYGDFSKAIKEAVKQALPANVSDMFELTRYNSLIANALRTRWEQAALSSLVVEQANQSIDEILSGEGAIAGEVSLRELLDEFVKANMEDAAERRWGSPEIRFEENESRRSSTLSVFFDPQPENAWKDEFSFRGNDGRHDYSLKHRLHMHLTEEVRPATDSWRPEIRVGKVYAAAIDEKNITQRLDVRNKWERMLAALYYGQAVVLIDCDADDFSYGLDG